MPRRASLFGYCAMVRIPLRSPTTDVAVPPAFEPRPLRLASWHFFLLAPQASVPISADHCLLQKAPECKCAPCTIIVRRYRSPSLLMRFCGSLSPEFLRPGRNPRKQPTSRLFENRYGSSIVRTYVRAICVPTPLTCLSKDTSGYASLAIFSIRPSYSLMGSFSDSISLSSGSRSSRNSALTPSASFSLTCCVPHLGSRSP